MLANSSDLADLRAQPEGQRLAFVRRAFRVDELAETLAALANAHGGAIIVGVSGRGKKIEGVTDVESARLAAYAPAKSFEAASRTVSGKYCVFARYVGDE